MGIHGSLGTSDASSPYLSIVAMLIESYVVDSAWSLATAISVASSSPSAYMFITNDSTVKVRNDLVSFGVYIYLYITIFSRSSPTSLLFIGSQISRDGRHRQRRSSRPYSGTVVCRLPLMTPAVFVLECLQPLLSILYLSPILIRPFSSF